MKWQWRTIAALAAAWLTLNGLAMHPVLAKITTSPATPHGFTTESFALPGGVVEHSSPVLADLNEDGVQDIIIGTTAQNGADNNTRNRPTVLVAMQGNGAILWSKELDAPIESSPAVGDINHDGHLEVVVSTGGDAGDLRHNGSVIAFDHNGNQLWRFNLVDNSARGWNAAAFSSPTLCDVDGDGTQEIVLGGWDQRIYLLDSNGQPLWNNLNRPPGFPADAGYYNADTSWSTAACADLNGDGQAEIIIGADMTGGSTLPDGTPTEDGGFLYIFDKDGNVLVRRYLPETIYASPAVGDLNQDGRPEIVVGTGWYWWNQHGRKTPSYVYTFDTSNVFSNLNYADANKLPDLAGWPQQTTYPGFSSPALADLDGDGSLEVIIGTGDPFTQNDNIPGAGQVYAWHANGQVVSGWPVSPKNVQGSDAQITSSPTVADIDGDGQVEVLFSMIWDVNVYSPNGAFKEWLGAKWTTVDSPAIGDTDGDGKVDVWVGSSNAEGDPSNGYLWHFKSDSAALGARPWPMFHHDARHTGLYPAGAKAVVSATQIFVLRNTDNPDAPTQLTSTLQLSNSGGAAYNWRLLSKPDRVTLNAERGTVDPDSSQTLQVTVDTDGMDNGSTTLGDIQIELTSAGNPLPGSPLNLSVTAFVGPVQSAYLPLIQR